VYTPFIIIIIIIIIIVVVVVVVVVVVMLEGSALTYRVSLIRCEFKHEIYWCQRLWFPFNRYIYLHTDHKFGCSVFSMLLKTTAAMCLEL
jgi:hypothetical protein